VMGHGIRSVLIGLAVGVAMAVGATRLLSAMLSAWRRPMP
jgi:hypothetical protein